jgi:hypothetical protein
MFLTTTKTALPAVLFQQASWSPDEPECSNRPRKGENGKLKFENGKKMRPAGHEGADNGKS